MAGSVDRVMLSAGSHSVDTFMIDGGSTCHVLGFRSVASDASLRNRRMVDITIVVGGGTQMQEEIFKDVRIVSGFGANLLSGPRLEDEGYALPGKGCLHRDGELIPWPSPTTRVRMGILMPLAIVGSGWAATEDAVFSNGKVPRHCPTLISRKALSLLLSARPLALSTRGDCIGFLAPITTT